MQQQSLCVFNIESLVSLLPKPEPNNQNAAPPTKQLDFSNLLLRTRQLHHYAYIHCRLMHCTGLLYLCIQKERLCWVRYLNNTYAYIYTEGTRLSAQSRPKNTFRSFVRSVLWSPGFSSCCCYARISLLSHTPCFIASRYCPSIFYTSMQIKCYRLLSAI